MRIFFARFRFGKNTSSFSLTRTKDFLEIFDQAQVTKRTNLDQPSTGTRWSVSLRKCQILIASLARQLSSRSKTEFYCARTPPCVEQLVYWSRTGMTIFLMPITSTFHHQREAQVSVQCKQHPSLCDCQKCSSLCRRYTSCCSTILHSLQYAIPFKSLFANTCSFH